MFMLKVRIFRRGWVTFGEYFEGKGASPTNQCWFQKTRANALSCGIKICAVHHLVLSQYTNLADGRTELWQQYRVLHYMQPHGKTGCFISTKCKNWADRLDGSRCCQSPCECGRLSESTRWRCAAVDDVRAARNRYHVASREGADDGLRSRLVLRSPRPCRVPSPASPAAPLLPYRGTDSAETLPLNQEWSREHSAPKIHTQITAVILQIPSYPVS